jgi:hypothetical protein
MERVRRKLTRLLLVSSGVMALGFLTVLIAVFYRVSQDAARVDDPVAADIAVAPQDLVSASIDEDSLVLVIGGEDPRVEVRRLEDGALVATFRLSGNGTP